MFRRAFLCDRMRSPPAHVPGLRWGWARTVPLVPSWFLSMTASGLPVRSGPSVFCSRARRPIVSAREWREERGVVGLGREETAAAYVSAQADPRPN